MKILRIVYDYPPPWEGLSPGPYELSKAQVELGHKVTVICGFWPRQKFGEHPTFPGLTVRRFLREPFRGGIFFSTAIFAFLAIFFERFKNKPDLIHGHGHLPLYFHIYKRIFGKIDKIPYFFHLHITAAGREKQAKRNQEKIDLVTRLIEWPLHKLSDKLGCQVADAIITVSDSVKDETVKYYGAEPKKIFVVENGVNCDLFQPLKLDQRASDQLERMAKAIQPPKLTLKDKFILFVGTHDKRKNLDTLILSLKYLPQEYKLLTMGSGPKEYLGKLELILKEEVLENRVVFCGFIPYSETPKIYQNADVLVLPSFYEGFPKVVLEALACGVPVLASGFKIRKKIAGLNFFESLEPEVIAKKIKQLVDENQSVDIEFIKREYSWTEKAKQIQNIYLKVPL